MEAGRTEVAVAMADEAGSAQKVIIVVFALFPPNGVGTSTLPHYDILRMEEHGGCNSFRNPEQGAGADLLSSLFKVYISNS